MFDTTRREGGLLILAALACLSPAQPAFADTVTGNGTVTATVTATCNLVATPTIAFGTISGIGTVAADVTAQGTITVICSTGASYTIYIGDGANRVAPGSGNRQMANGAGRLPYQLYKTNAYAAIWDATGGTSATGGSGGVNGTGTSANQNHIVYGRIAAGTAVPSVLGNYSDTVLITVTY
jgi:spore coat protein U-like protein